MNYLNLRRLALAVAAALASSWLTAATVNWTGATNTDWTTATNWDLGVPGAGDNVVIAGGTNMPTLSSTTPVLGDVTVGLGTTLTFAGWGSALNAATVTVNGTVSHLANTATADPWLPDNRVHIVATDVIVAAGGSIDADGKGYQGISSGNGRGPGGGLTGTSPGGAGHGGFGGRGTALNPLGGSVYGTASAPETPGSSGGSYQSHQGNHGGGVVRIEASGEITVNGEISADGQRINVYSGGGAGGSIYVSCQTIAGSGLIHADGTDVPATHVDDTGAGGGGRIAVTYNAVAQAAAATPTIQLRARGGIALKGNRPRTSRADPGSIYLTDASFFPTETLSAGRIIIPGFTSWSPASLTVSDGLAGLPEGLTLTVGGNITVSGTGGIELVRGTVNVGGSLAIDSGIHGASFLYGGSGASLNVAGDVSVKGGWLEFHDGATDVTGLSIGGNLAADTGGDVYVYSGNGGALDYGALVEVTGDIVLSSDGWVIPVSEPITGSGPLFRAANVTIATVDAGFDATGQGFAGGKPGQGPAGGGYSGDWGAGGGHGGVGGDAGPGNAIGGSPTYGNEPTPVASGSGGGGRVAAAGGGVVRLEVTGTIDNDGVIAADGAIATYVGGGGAGGSVYLSTDTVTGGGTISANGGNPGTSFGPPGGGGGNGGGGRIAGYFQTDTFTGSVSVDPGVRNAGAAGQDGEAGTIVWRNCGSNLPPVAQCQDISVILGPAGTVDIVADDVDNSSSDPDSDPLTLSIDVTSFDCNSIGANAVTLTVTDGCASDDCMATVTVTDPSYSCCMAPACTLRVTVADGDWASPATWTAGTVPAAGEIAIVEHNVTITAPTAALTGANINGSLTFDGWNSTLNADTVTVNGTVTHLANTASADPWLPDHRVHIVATDVIVAAGGSIDADGKGYQGISSGNGRGPGGGLTGTSPGGAGHGGFGGRGTGLNPLGGGVYGTASAPETPGSSGGSYQSHQGNHGGGVVRIEASGEVTVNGEISADGQRINVYSGGGAGGSIYVSAETIAGSGVIHADGTDVPATHVDDTGGGGGGRIAVTYDAVAQGAAPTPTIQLRARGGIALKGNRPRTSRADPGSIYLTDASFFPTETLSAGRIIIPGFTSWSPASLTISDGLAGLPEGLTLTVGGDIAATGTGGIELVRGTVNVGGSLAIDSGIHGGSFLYGGSGASLNVAGDVSVKGGWLEFHDGATEVTGLSIGGNLAADTGGDVYVYSGNGGALDYGALVEVTGDIVLSSGGWVIPVSDPATGTGPLFRAANVTIATVDAGFDATGQGFAAGKPGQGPAGGGYSGDWGAGGGHGGVGGDAGPGNAIGGSPTYGDENAPVTSGSGGSDRVGAAGGGVVRLEVAGTIDNDGVIRADGGTASYVGGGGAGGSIYLSTNTVTGSGTISANGGNPGYSFGPPGGGGGNGGGGRIAGYFQTDTFSGSLSVDPGVRNAGAAGQDGTVGTIVWAVLNYAPTAGCQDITVALAANGTVVITPQQIDNNSQDPDGDTLTLSLDVDTFGCADVAASPITVTLTVDDSNGGVDQCTAAVTVNSAGTCEELRNFVLDAICEADSMTNSQQVLALIDAKIAEFLNGGSICDAITLAACRAQLLVDVGLSP